jgi:hypothetical protein
MGRRAGVQRYCGKYMSNFAPMLLNLAAVASSGSWSFALRLIPGLILVAVAAWAGALLIR